MSTKIAEKCVVTPELCNAGRAPTTDAITCNDGTVWKTTSGAQSPCIRFAEYCPVNLTLANGSVGYWKEKKGAYFSKAWLTCNAGFEMNGSRNGQLRCKHSDDRTNGFGAGNWTGMWPTCELKESYCGITSLRNGVVTYPNGRVLGASPYPTCNPGYELKGLKQSRWTCNKFNKTIGRWSKAFIACVRETPIACGSSIQDHTKDHEDFSESRTG
eukprot:845831_1